MQWQENDSKGTVKLGMALLLNREQQKSEVILLNGNSVLWEF